MKRPRWEWSTIVIRVDEETGEIITATQAEQHYIITKKIKHAAKSEKYSTGGTITYTKFYKKNPQTKLAID